MPDVTVAVSEQVFSEALRVLVDNFVYEASGSDDYGAFSAGYDVRMRLEGGAIDLRDDGTIELRELDVTWDRLKFSLGLDIPEITIGGGCITVLGQQICFPGFSLFSADPDVRISVNLAILVRHELSAVCRLTTELYDPDVDPVSGSCKQLLDGIGISTDRREWQFYLNPQTIDFDPFDFADTVGELLEDLLTAAVDSIVGFMGEGFVNSVVNTVMGLLDVGDDIHEWLSDLFNISFGMRNLVLTFVGDFFGNCVRVFAIEDPFPLIPAAGGLIPVTTPLIDVEAAVTDAEMTITADLGA